MFALFLTAATAFVLLDTFLIPKAYAQVTAGVSSEPATESSPAAAAPAQTAEPEITATSYQDENITITVETVVEHDTTFYVADIKISDAGLLKTALAQGVYGRNIKAATSEIAQDNDAIFAINGDYYGFRDAGFVIRNGVLYRATPSGNELLVIDESGDFSIASENDVTAQALLDEGAWQVLAFGPALVQDGAISVGEDEEILGKSKNSNPRTAIGQIDKLHYIVIVSDGRTDESAGLSLYQLAGEFEKRGAVVAYNLDGGGSSTMVLNGTVVNETTNGRSGSEREVSDIVYIGY